LKLRKKIYETEITLRKANWKKNETQFINNIILKDKIKKKLKKKKIEWLKDEIEKNIYSIEKWPKK
jgi:hypothetical protein